MNRACKCNKVKVKRERFFHGEMREPFFEGWYFKHQKGKQTIAIIPGIFKEKYGDKGAFIQVITNQSSYFVPYPYSEFHASKDELCIRIGDNLFTSKGIILNIHYADLNLTGKVTYGTIDPLEYRLMGPLSHIPHLECSHAILSMKHKLDGMLVLNGHKYFMKRGNGYIEMDWGRSFPSKYSWTQMNDHRELSIVAAVAKIPILKYQFKGCFAILHHREEEIRFASYLGAKVVKWGRNGFVIKQGRKKLYVMFLAKTGTQLHAPVRGIMCRTIYENCSCPVRYVYVKGKQVVFDIVSRRASVER